MVELLTTSSGAWPVQRFGLSGGQCKCPWDQVLIWSLWTASVGQVAVLGSEWIYSTNSLMTETKEKGGQLEIPSQASFNLSIPQNCWGAALFCSNLTVRQKKTPNLGLNHGVPCFKRK